MSRHRPRPPTRRGRTLPTHQPPQRPIPPWLARLDDLLAGRQTVQPVEPGPAGAAGAELVVTDPTTDPTTDSGPDAGEVFRAPLARHYRVDDYDPQLIWIRPILGGYAPADPSSEHDYLFHLNTARRRSLHIARATVQEDDVVLQLRNGQSARIGPATGPARTQLWLWDQFMAITLTAQQAAQLAELREDSWIGPYG